MVGTLSSEQKKDWIAHVLALVYINNLIKNATAGYNLYFLPYVREPRLPLILNLNCRNIIRKYHPVNLTVWNNFRESLSVPLREHKSWPVNNSKGIIDCMIKGVGKLS